MPDQYTHVTKKGLGSRLGNSLKGILVGLLLFIASFAVLFWNEGRVDVSEIAQTAIQIQENEPAADAQGELVTVTGKLVTDETVGDGLYLKAGNYIAVRRNVEIYAF